MPARQTIVLIVLVCLWGAVYGCGGSDVDRARRYINDGKYASAIALLGERVVENPDDADACFLLGVAYIRSGRLREAEAQFVRASTLKPDSGLQIGREYKKAGDAAFREEKIDTGVRFFKVAIRYQPGLKKTVARSVYEKGKDLSLAGEDARAIELHRYAMASDPLLGRDLGRWYAARAANTRSAHDKAALTQLALQFAKAHQEEIEKNQKASARVEAEKNAMSVRARMQRVIDQRLDERAWARLASKSVNTLGAEETVRWTAKYYAKAGHEIKRLVLSDQEWSDIGRFADRTQMFFLSAKDFWYLKSSRQAPQRLGAAIIKAQGIQFRGGATIDLALKTETPPVEVFYWISPRS